MTPDDDLVKFEWPDAYGGNGVAWIPGDVKDTGICIKMMDDTSSRGVLHRISRKTARELAAFLLSAANESERRSAAKKGCE